MKGILFGCPSDIIIPLYFNDINKALPVIDFQHIGQVVFHIPSPINTLHYEHVSIPLYWYDPLSLYELAIEPAYHNIINSYGADIYVHSYEHSDIIKNTHNLTHQLSSSPFIGIIDDNDREVIVIERSITPYHVRRWYPYDILKTHLYFLFQHIFSISNIHTIMDISQFSVGIFPYALYRNEPYLWGYVLIYKETIIPTAMFYSPFLFRFRDYVMENRYNIKTEEKEVHLYNNSIKLNKMLITSEDAEYKPYDINSKQYIADLYSRKIIQYRNDKTFRYVSSCSYMWYEAFNSSFDSRKYRIPVGFFITIGDTIFPARLIIRQESIALLSTTHIHYLMVGNNIAKPIYELYQ